MFGVLKYVGFGFLEVPVSGCVQLGEMVFNRRVANVNGMIHHGKTSTYDPSSNLPKAVIFS